MPYYLIDKDDLCDNELIDKIMGELYCVVEFRTNGKTTVSPKLEFDKPFNSPSPCLPEYEQELLDNIE